MHYLRIFPWINTTRGRGHQFSISTFHQFVGQYDPIFVSIFTIMNDVVTFVCDLFSLLIRMRLLYYIRAAFFRVNNSSGIRSIISLYCQPLCSVSQLFVVVLMFGSCSSSILFYFFIFSCSDSEVWVVLGVD